MSYDSRTLDSPPPRKSTSRRRRQKLGWAALCVGVGLAMALAVRTGCMAFRPPIAGTWLAFGAAAAILTAALGAFKVKGQWTTLAIAFVVGTLIGVSAYALAAPPQWGVRDDPNREMADHVLRIDRALDRYASRTYPGEGLSRFPTAPTFLAAITKLGRGAPWLENPFSQAPQTAIISPAGSPHLVTAAQHADEAPLPALNTVLGPGRHPNDAPPSPLTYGTLIYDHDPKTDTFVLYGIGKLGDNAVIVATADGKP